MSSPTRTAPLKKRAPTLYLIIIYKLIKGSLCVGLAITLYCLSDNNLPQEYRRLMDLLRIEPGNKFFANLAGQVGQLTERRVLQLAAGTFVFSLFSLVEGAGLLGRVSWAGWLAIGESAFFIPIELFELSRHLSLPLVLITVINVVIVWYLYANRDRLFRHHEHPALGSAVG